MTKKSESVVYLVIRPSSFSNVWVIRPSSFSNVWFCLLLCNF